MICNYIAGALIIGFYSQLFLINGFKESLLQFLWLIKKLPF